jgi:hypothetical protein
MRLRKVERGQGILRLVFPIMPLKIGARVPDVVRTLMYRPEMFGKAYNAWIQEILRGPSKWSVWERELFAAFTSSCNQCVF